MPEWSKGTVCKTVQSSVQIRSSPPKIRYIFLNFDSSASNYGQNLYIQNLEFLCWPSKVNNLNRMATLSLRINSDTI